jgi:uncharacterized SAM-binding protein YcdF (DUF218 family)
MYDNDEEGGRPRHAGGGRRRRSAEASLTSGIVFAVAFGIAWSVTGLWFFVFPLIFAGVMPMVEGLRRLASQRRRPQLAAGAKPGGVTSEKQILLVAKEEKGVVTPALVALKTELSIQEAEKALENMAQLGYALMRVTDSGRIEYEFPEFMPRLDGDAGRL